MAVGDTEAVAVNECEGLSVSAPVVLTESDWLRSEECEILVLVVAVAVGNVLADALGETELDVDSEVKLRVMDPRGSRLYCVSETETEIDETVNDIVALGDKVTESERVHVVVGDEVAVEVSELDAEGLIDEEALGDTELDMVIEVEAVPWPVSVLLTVIDCVAVEVADGLKLID